MPFRTVETLENNVSAILTGTDLDEVNDLFGCFERAAATLIQEADVPEASGRLPFFLYDGVTDYEPDPTIFGAAIVDVRPQGQNRLPWDTVAKTYISDFDRYKCFKTPSGYVITMEYYEGQPVLRINSSKAQQRLIWDSMSTTTGWSAAGGASGLALDTTVYWQQPASLRFNLAASGSEGTLSKTQTTGTNINMTAYIGVGVGFVPVMLPATGHVTAITLRIGSDASNYYQVTVSGPFIGNFIANFFQLVAFNLAYATKVGSPVATAMNYADILFEYDGTFLPNVRAGGLWFSLPTPQEMLFYSPAIFQAAGGGPTRDISSVNDSIILGNPAYNIFVRECAKAVALQQGGAIGSGIVATIDIELYGEPGNSDRPGLYAKFRGSNPSEELRTVGNWYYDGGNSGGYDSGDCD